MLIYEEEGLAVMKDSILEKSNDEVKIKFRLPEDYTFKGVINGSIKHLKSKVSNKLRSNPTELELIGENRVFQWGSLDCPSYKIINKEGSIEIKQSTFQNASF